LRGTDDAHRIEDPPAAFNLATEQCDPLGMRLGRAVLVEQPT